MYTWVKQLVVFYILVTTVTHLLPKKGYEKYIRFFCGMLLLWILASPVLKLIKDPELTKELFREIMMQENLLYEINPEELENSGEVIFVQEYQNRIEQEIRDLAKQEWYVYQTKIWLNEQMTLEEVELVVSPLQHEKFVYIEGGTYEENKDTYPQAVSLGKQIAQQYGVSEQQIRFFVLEN